jgi:hypothetical protein
MNWYTLIITIVTTIITLIIGFFTTKYYYIKASKQLTEAANKLIKLNNLITRGLEAGNIAKFNRDKDNEPTGIIFDETKGEVIMKVISECLNSTTETKKDKN